METLEQWEQQARCHSGENMTTFLTSFPRRRESRMDVSA